MGGKGGSGGSQQPMEQPTPQTTGGWSAVGDTTTAAKPKEAPPVTEAPGQQQPTAFPTEETQPYMPPGFGNYPTSNTNLSPLGDTLVAGMQETPGKRGPTTPQYQGQV